jgi:hypothetical protein
MEVYYFIRTFTGSGTQKARTWVVGEDDLIAIVRAFAETARPPEYIEITVMSGRPAEIEQIKRGAEYGRLC